MNKPTFEAVHRGDYQVPGFLIDSIDLVFRLGEQHTRVTAQSRLRRNKGSENNNHDLVLYGESLELVKVSIDGDEIDSGRMVLTD